MRSVEDWDTYFLKMAALVATRSKDPNTQVGAIIVKNRRVISTGYNGFPTGIVETAGMWERPLKYRYVIHAEANAIGAAARNGVAVEGSTMYLTAFPCNASGCARLIISAGISRVVARTVLSGWNDDCRFTSELFDLAKIDWRIIDGQFDVQ